MCAMMNLDVRALQAAQVAVGFHDEKAFRISLGDQAFTVQIYREAEPASHTRPASYVRPASLDESAEVIGEMFRRLAAGGRVLPLANLDLEKAQAEAVEFVCRSLNVPVEDEEEEEIPRGMTAAGRADRTDRTDRTDTTDTTDTTDRTDTTDTTYSIFPEMPVEDEDDGEDVLWGPLDVSERADGPGEVDVEAGWEAYRREIAETMGPTILPAWADAPAQLKECFAAGIWAALEPVAAKGVVQSLREEKERLERVIARHWEVTSREMKGGAQ